MSDISPDLHDFLSHEFSRASTRLDIRLRGPLPHQSNRLYDLYFEGQRYIVKEYLKEEEFNEAAPREYRSLRLMAPLGLAPQPVSFYPGSDSFARPLVVYEYMAGRMWDRDKPSSRDLAELAKTWLLMNAAESDPHWPSRSDRFPFRVLGRLEESAGDYAAYCEDEYREVLHIADQVMALLELRKVDLQELDKMEAPRCFSRADPRFANIIERPDGRLGMVDWEDSGWVDPALDLADLLTHPNQEDLLDWVEWGAFLRPYEQAREALGDRTFQRRRHLYMGLLTLFRLIVLLKMGVERTKTGELAGWKINGLPANERLQRYLLKAAQWPEMEIDPGPDPADRIHFFPGG
jgi:aminoglycoside phosphotransferase (APT) family kinase protein